MPRAARHVPRRGDLLLVTLLGCASLVLGGCSGADEPTASGSRTAAARATPQEAATTWPPKGSSGALATYLYKYGVSWRVPRAWSLSADDTDPDDDSGDSRIYLWNVSKKKVGLAVNVQNSRSTVPEWRAIVQQSRTGQTKVFQKAVSVPGYGEGSHVRYRAKGVTDDLLIVTSIDGVLLQMDVYTTKDSDPGLADEILSSLKRTT